MIATLKFDLTDQDDKKEHYRCIKSLDMACVLFEFYYNSRRRIENQITTENIEIDNDDLLDKVFEEFAELLEEKQISIFDLIE